MAEIKPVKGWRYAAHFTPEIADLTSPLFDVVSDKQRQALYRHPYNSIHLTVPQGPEPAAAAAQRLQEWKEKEVLMQDELPAIYAYYQYFRLPGSSLEYCRKGFLCHIKAYDWAEKVVLRHENTIPGSVNDRSELLAATLLQPSPTHGLYTDPQFKLEPYLDESMKVPIYETEDYQGVRDVLSVIQDAKVIKRFIRLMQEKQVLLADGHHRYEGSLAFRKAMMKANPHHTGREAYNYHFMYLTNTESDHLMILPTHRVVTTMALTDEEFLEKLKEYFLLQPQDDGFILNEVIVGKKWAFGLYLGGQAYKIRLKPEVHGQLYWHFPEVVKALDLTVMHFFIFEKILGIIREQQREHPALQYIRNFTQCLGLVDSGKARLALITNEVTMEEVKAVCYSGAMMPQKSTFFYPKVISGFLFSSIEQHEFESEVDPCFELAPAAGTAGQAGPGL
jgi:uncharacterized protein (DUF1015 family)